MTGSELIHREQTGADPFSTPPRTGFAKAIQRTTDRTQGLERLDQPDASTKPSGRRLDRCRVAVGWLHLHLSVRVAENTVAPVAVSPAVECCRSSKGLLTQQGARATMVDLLRLKELANP